jgi:hypothetical protein
MKITAASIDESIQKTCWKIADTLAKILRSGIGQDAADPKWTVAGQTTRAWQISHPDLPLIKDEEGTQKNVILQMYIEVKEGKWFVVAENTVIGQENHSSPRAVIIAKEEEPPNQNWDIEGIAKAAALFFAKQKEILTKQAQEISPTIPPGTDLQTSTTASRKKRLASRVVAFLNDVIEPTAEPRPDLVYGDNSTLKNIRRRSGHNENLLNPTGQWMAFIDFLDERFNHKSLPGADNNWLYDRNMARTLQQHNNVKEFARDTSYDLLINDAVKKSILAQWEKFKKDYNL